MLGGRSLAPGEGIGNFGKERLDVQSGLGAGLHKHTAQLLGPALALLHGDLPDDGRGRG